MLSNLTAKVKYSILFLAALAISFSLARISGNNMNMLFSFLMGYSTNRHIISVSSFLILVLMLQLLNSDLFLFHFQNAGMLAIRHGSIVPLFSTLFQRVAIRNFLFVISLIISGIIVSIQKGVCISSFYTVAVLHGVYAFILSMCFSLLQFLLLIHFPTAEVFLWETIAALSYAFFNSFVEHEPLPNLWLWFGQVTILSLVTVVMFIISRKHFIKEWGQYAN